MPIIARDTEVDPDDRGEAVAIMRAPLTRACDAPGCLDVAITVDSVDPSGALLTGRRTAEQVDHWNGDHHSVLFLPSHRPPTVRVLTSRIGLEVVRAIDTPQATHIRYGIRRRTDERTT